MSGDQLSEVFSLVEVEGVFSGAVIARGAWVASGPIPHALKFFVMLSGRARLTADGVPEPVELQEGDVGIFNERGWVELRGGPLDETPRRVEPQLDFPPSALIGADLRHDDVYVGGRIDVDESGAALLRQALPPFSHVRASAPGGEGLRITVRRLFEELAGQRLGSAFAVRQYGQLLLLETLRAYLEQAEQPPAGWLRLLADERLRPAVTMMHREPGRAWGLAELARACAMSRASFAERFRRVAGMPPLTYLSKWRMMLAQRALADDETRIGSLATRLGYASESAFSNAFKRQIGVSPAAYRRQLRAGREEEPARSA